MLQSAATLMRLFGLPAALLREEFIKGRAAFFPQALELSKERSRLRDAFAIRLHETFPSIFHLCYQARCL